MTTPLPSIPRRIARRAQVHVFRPSLTRPGWPAVPSPRPQRPGFRLADFRTRPPGTRNRAASVGNPSLLTLGAIPTPEIARRGERRGCDEPSPNCGGSQESGQGCKPIPQASRPEPPFIRAATAGGDGGHRRRGRLPRSCRGMIRRPKLRRQGRRRAGFPSGGSEPGPPRSADRRGREPRRSCRWR